MSQGKLRASPQGAVLATTDSTLASQRPVHPRFCRQHHSSPFPPSTPGGERFGNAIVCRRTDPVAHLLAHSCPRRRPSRVPTLELVFANGRCLRIPIGFDPEQLRASSALWRSFHAEPLPNDPYFPCGTTARTSAKVSMGPCRPQPSSAGR